MAHLKNPLKILLYTDTPIAGGAEKHIHLLAKYLQKNGHHITVVCSSYPSLDAWCENMKKDDIQVIRLKVFHKHDPRHLWQLRKIIKIKQPDLLHIHLWNPGACRYAFYAASPQKIKIIATEHDPFELKGLKKMIKKMTLKRTHHTIAVSEANKQKMLEWYPELKNTMTVIHNGIEISDFQKKLQDFSAEKSLVLQKNIFKSDEKDFIILSIATLHPRKGLIFLLEAFEKVHEKIPHSKLVIVGEGPQREELLQKTRELQLTQNVLFLGHQEKIPEILKSSDLFVLSSVKEAFGLVLLEAMAARIPIIATKVGGIPEIIQDGKNGLLCVPENSEDLSQKILEVIKDENVRKNSTSHHADMLKMFDVKNMVEKTENLYTRILNQSSS